ncbi:MAG: ABC transporter permease [Actinomycetota bacterium]|nr:ABC transporter permease [Actinomycetota bacterium]
MGTPTGGVVGQRRWYYPVLAAPGIVWLLLLFILPFYAISAVAFGTRDQIFALPIPAWNPLEWQFETFMATAAELTVSGGVQSQFLRTLVYVSIAVATCLVVGYPVSYYVARYGGRLKVLLLTLMIAPFWMSYLMRMLAWVNLLTVKPEDPGLVNRLLMATPFVGDPISWSSGSVSHLTVILGLVYGYIPFFILPLYAALDRIDRSQLEASRDLGANPAWTFLRVTLPLSKQGILAGAVIITLPMFGDYYTPNLMTASPDNTMIGNAIDFSLQGGQGQQPKGAGLTLLLSAFIAALMVYYLLSVARAGREAQR